MYNPKCVFNIYKQDEFHGRLSGTRKKLYTSGVWSSTSQDMFSFLPGGCATHPSICTDQKAIEAYDAEIKNLRTQYDKKYLENKRAYLAVRTANTDNAYITYFINETIKAVQTLSDYQELTSDTLEVENYALFQRYEAKHNATDYLASLLGELEYSLSDIRNMIQQKQTSQGISLAVQYLVEFSINRFVKAFSRAYAQVTGPENILQGSAVSNIFSADPADAAIMLDSSHPRYAEVMAKYGVDNKAKLTFKQKFKLTPKVFKQMMTNIKDKFKSFGSGVKKWTKVRSWQGFKGKLSNSLKGPIAKLETFKSFFTSKATRKYYVNNYKLSWSQGGMMAIGILGDAVQIAVQTAEWNKVAVEMAKAREQYKKYRDNLNRELQNITTQTQEIESLWPDIIATFKNLSLSFKSIIETGEQYDDFSDVIGLAKLPVNVTSPLFTIDFNAVTKANIESSQAAVIGFMRSVDNDITDIADQMRARAILYENVLNMTAVEQSVKSMLDTFHSVYAFSSSETIKKFGNDLDTSNVVCSVAQLRKTKNQYDYYPLEPFRPSCDVSSADFKTYESQAAQQRQEQILINTVTDYKGNSLSSLLDLVHASYRASSDDDLRGFGAAITDQQVICKVSQIFPNKQMFDFISLKLFRPDCSSVTAADFKKMKTDAEAIRKASSAVESVMDTCEQFNRVFCPCPALIAQMNGLSEENVVALIKVVRPNLTQYCGTTGCACVQLKH